MEAPSPQIISKLHNAIETSTYQINKYNMANIDIEIIKNKFNKQLDKGKYKIEKYNKYEIKMAFSYKTAYYENDDVPIYIISDIQDKIRKYIEESIPAKNVKVHIIKPDNDMIDEGCCIINMACCCLPFMLCFLPKWIYRSIDNKRMYVTISFETIMPVKIVKIID